MLVCRTEIHKLLLAGKAIRVEDLKQNEQPALSQIMRSSIFGCAAKHRSVKFDVGALAVVRYWLMGSRDVILIHAEFVLDFLRQKQQGQAQTKDVEILTSGHAVNWVMYMTQKDFAD